MTDTLVKTTTLKAAPGKVWSALSDARAFGAWFGMSFEQPFAQGQTIIGRLAPTQYDEDLAKSQAPWAGIVCEFRFERVEAPRCLAFRWRPGVELAEGDTAQANLVTFELEPSGGGTKLTITESGFDTLPPERRAAAVAKSEAGWNAQLGLIARYLAKNP